MSDPTLDYRGRENGEQRSPQTRSALGLGIIGLLLSPWVVGGGLGIAAMILGIRAVKNGRSNGVAYTGIILGLLAVLWAGVMMLFIALYNPLTPRVMAARRAGTIAQLKTIRGALEAFRTDNGRYPSDAENLDALLSEPAGMGGTWEGPYVKNHVLDMWGYPIFYRLPGKANPARFDLFSAGEDHAYETADDICESSKP